AALAKHREEKMALPMPTKRRSYFVQSPIDNCTPPDTSSASEDEGSLRRKAALSTVLAQTLQSPDYWINRSDRGSRVDLPPAIRGMNRGQSRSSMLDTADGTLTQAGMCINVRLGTQMGQKNLTDFPQPDPNTPKPEGRQIIPVKGEPLGVVSNWPPALQAALARWGATQAKSPALTALDITGKPLYTLTYGSQQIGFLLGSCGVSLALTSEVCLKGLPKTPNGEIVQFRGQQTETAYASPANRNSLYQQVSYFMLLVLPLIFAGPLQFLLATFHVILRGWVTAEINIDLHWAMMAHKDQKDINLSSIRMLIVADGANPCEWLSFHKYNPFVPIKNQHVGRFGHCFVNTFIHCLLSGSVSSCDAFLNVFQSHGLRPEVICPCATSPEALTVAIRRPGTRGAPLPARAILSMGGLSHGVIRVNTEDKNSALTVQDVGHIMPGALMCIVKPDGPPQLCKTDEIGEIVINSRAGGTMYYGLPGVTKNTFEVIPVNQAGAPIGEVPFARTGLLGFVGPVRSAGVFLLRWRGHIYYFIHMSLRFFTQ
ncbi:hypothetical protein XENOCAPTIV_001496, partial [Xenoophorus captivus]